VALKTIIKSFGNLADMKKIKAELVPDVLTAGEWSRWNTEARSILKKDSAFGNLPTRSTSSWSGTSPSSFEEKTYNNSRRMKGFFDRVKDHRGLHPGRACRTGFGLVHRDVRLLHRVPEGYTAVSETVISSGSCCSRSSPVPFPLHRVQTSFEELFGKIEKLEETFSRSRIPS